MDLMQKGTEANVGTLKEAKATMSWTTAADFDLAAAFQKGDNTWDMVYFQKKGDLNAEPFMQLSEDAGVGDAGGENEEVLTIKSLEGKKKVHLLVWDYGQVTKGGPARFAESDVKLSLVDDKGTSYDVKLDAGQIGNVACIATIENGPTGAKIINTSVAGVLKKFSKLEDIMGCLDLPM